MNYHFISGLPRSGSTLLSTILNQNPEFHADISSPLARFVRSIVTESHAGPGYQLRCDEEKRIRLIRGLVDNYHYEYIDTKTTCFNTNRGWTALVDLLNITHPNSKIICCVRDIKWILDSFEVLFRKNPFSISKMYSPQEAENVYTRCNALMSPGHTLRFAYDALKEAISGPNSNNIILIEYDQLVKNPELIMKSLYKFMDIEYFKHDFDDVEGSYELFDLDAGIKNLHTIRKGVKYIDRFSILPPDITYAYSDMEVWRHAIKNVQY